MKIIERDLAIIQQLAQAKLDNPVGPSSLRDLVEEDFSAFLDGLPEGSLSRTKHHNHPQAGN